MDGLSASFQVSTICVRLGSRADDFRDGTLQKRLIAQSSTAPAALDPVQLVQEPLWDAEFPGCLAGRIQVGGRQLV